MENNILKIEISIDIHDPVQMRAATIFLQSLGSDQPLKLNTSTEADPKEPPSEEKQKRRTRKQKNTEEQDNRKEQDNQEEQDTQKETTIKIEDIRAAVSLKVKEHKDAIKAKLNSLKAPNISSLKGENYSEFMDFLNDLD